MNVSQVNLGRVQSFVPSGISLAGVYVARYWEEGALPSSPGISSLMKGQEMLPTIRQLLYLRQVGVVGSGKAMLK